MDELMTFVHARLNEDENEALAASPGPWKANGEQDEVLAADDIEVATGFALSGNQLRATVRHIVRHDPPRVLCDIQAKRATLVRCQEEMWSGIPRLVHFAKMTVWEMAQRWADHEKFSESWRP